MSARCPLLVVAAHPDDETLGAGALLARRRGARVVHLTDGAPRDWRWWPEAWPGEPPRDRGAYAALRRRELEAALALASLAPEAARCLGAADQEAALHLAELARALEAILAELAPRVVLAHPYEGGHPDHDAAAFVARAAVALRARAGPAPRLGEMTSYHAGGDGRLVTGAFLPAAGARELVHRLSPAERELKSRMLSAFASQRAVLAPFRVEEERFRRAPPADFARPPHAGALWSERLGFRPAGAELREQALRAARELRLGA